MTRPERVSRCDVHIHSKYSNRPSEWFLRKIGAPESFVDPIALYENCRAHGMDHVTISDHNTIDGALEIAHLPNTFVSCEVTTYFPEDGCKIHCLVLGITERQFQDIQAIRENIYDFRDYVFQENIIHSVAHPLFRINDKLTFDHAEKLLLLFNRFEGINGSRCHRACALANVIMDNLTADLLNDMADRHGIAPAGPTPWLKTLTAGSDDHSGLYVTNAHTVTPYAPTTMDFLDHLRAGDHWPYGEGGTSLRLAHSFYHIAYSYYANRFLGRTSRDSSLIGAMLQRMAGEEEAKVNGLRAFMIRPLARVAKGLKRRRLNETERFIVDEFEKLTESAQASETGIAQRNFTIAASISHQLTFTFLQRFATELKKGNLLESLQSISSLGPVVMGIAPYWTSFHTQHKDERFLREWAERSEATRSMKWKTGRKAWITDTFSDVNGVARTIQQMSMRAKERGESITILTCQDTAPDCPFRVHNFTPVGTMALPEYEHQAVVFPPFLDVLAYIEQEGFDELIISTPGPMGLIARAAGDLLGLDVRGIYHTDFPRYIQHFTEDYVLEDLARKYMAWFYGDMQTVYVSSRAYRDQLETWGIPSERLTYLPHGVDIDRFSPSQHDPDFWHTVGGNGGFKFLYVGRISKEKNLEPLLDAFMTLLEAGIYAECVLVGDGPHYRSLARTYNCPQIIFTGFLEGDALARAYAGADVFCFPSLTDTFGNAVLEALASGLPCIVGPEGGPAELVTHNETGLIVDTRNPAEIANAMRALMEDTERRERMSRQARRAAQTMSWDAAMDRFLEPTAYPA